MADRIMVPKDRVFERTQGCWNCKHSSSGTQFWEERRLHDLARAKGIASGSLLGENHQKVLNIRRMVDQLDHQVAAGNLRRCTTGRTPDGTPVGDLVAHNYLCTRWSAAEGASMARAGQKADKLPEELAEELDGKPVVLDTVLGSKTVS